MSLMKGTNLGNTQQAAQADRGPMGRSGLAFRYRHRSNQMAFLTPLYECSECGQLLETDDDSGSLLPCSRCGARSPKPITDMKEKTTIKFKQVGATGDPDLKMKIADEFYRETGEWRQIKMSIDRTNDYYEKTVINPETDEVLYYKKEPLSRHTNRGSAKQKTAKSKR